MNPNILVVRLSSLGDVILSSAAVLNLKIGFPESRITFLTKKSYAPIVSRFQGVAEVIAIDDSPSLFEFVRFLAELEQSEFDIIVDLHDNVRSYLVRKLLTAEQKVVYPRQRIARRRIVRDKHFPSKTTHTIEKYNDCILQLGLVPAAKRPILMIGHGPEVEKKVLNRDVKPPVIVVAPGAAFPNKQYPIERFAEIALELHKTHRAQIIWAVTEQDRNKISLEGKIRKEFLTELVDHPIEKLADIISQADLCIANDSGIAHLSSAAGTAVVAIFGPTHAALGFAPAGLHDRIVEVDEYCRPCSLHGAKACFREERFCFTRISTNAITEAADELLSRQMSSSKALFVDRDGTVIVDKPFDSNPDNIEFETGSIEALKLAQRMGFKIVIVSNQSGVARGYFGITDVERFNTRLEQMLFNNSVRVDAMYFCPHYANGKVPQFARACNCRKPAPGMVEKAALEKNLSLRKSYVVGDKLDDVMLGKVVGAKSFLVLTGQGRNYLSKIRALSKDSDDIICANLLEAVKKIEEAEKESEPVRC